MICPRYIVFDDALQDRRLGWTADQFAEALRSPLAEWCARRQTTRRSIQVAHGRLSSSRMGAQPIQRQAQYGRPRGQRCHEASGKEGIAERPGRLWVGVKLSYPAILMPQ